MRWNGSLSLAVMQAASSFFLMSAGRPAGATSPPMLRGATSKPCSFTVGTSGIDGLRFSANRPGMTSPLLAAAVSGATANSI